MPLPQPTIQYDPQQSGPLDQYSKAISLLNMLQSGQVQQQQLEAAKLENQQRQMQVHDQEVVRQAFVKNNGDLDATIMDAAKMGASPQTLQSLQQHALQVKSQTFELVNKQGEKAVHDADLLKGAYDTLSQTPAAQRPLIYPQLLKGLQSAQVDTSQMPPQYPGDAQLPMLGALVQGHAKQLADAKAQADLQKTQADTAKTQQETQYGPTGQAAEARYRNILGKVQAKQPVTPDEMEFAKSFEASEQKRTTQSDSLGVTSSSTSGPAGLASAMRGAAPKTGGSGGTGSSPQSVQSSLVDMIGQYKYNPSLLTRLSVRHPEILAQVGQKYPDFDQTTYNAKNKLITGYTSGPQSKEINAINTVASHLSILNDAVDALNNGSVPALNAVANKLGAAVGQSPQTTFQTIVHRVGPEITAAYIQGGGGEGERYANAEDFSINKTPQQLKNNIATTVNLLRGKIGALENQYKNGVGRDDFQQRFITPEAKGAFNKLAPQGGGGAGATRMYQGHPYTQQPDGSWKRQ